VRSNSRRPDATTDGLPQPCEWSARSRAGRCSLSTPLAFVLLHCCSELEVLLGYQPDSRRTHS